MWLSFMVQMCKIIICPGVLFNFKILIYRVVRRLKGQKNGPKWQKILPDSLHIISGTVHHMIVIFGTHGLNDDISSKFFHFSKFWFRGKRAKDDVKLPISACFAPYLRNCRSCRSHQNFDNDTYRCFYFLFFKKIQHFKVMSNWFLVSITWKKFNAWCAKIILFSLRKSWWCEKELSLYFILSWKRFFMK